MNYPPPGTPGTPVSNNFPSLPHPRIFVSHSHEDNKFGKKLVADLRHAIGDNNAVWYDASGGLRCSIRLSIHSRGLPCPLPKGGNICYYTTPYNDFVYEIQMSFVKSGSQGDTCGGIVFREEAASSYTPGIDTRYSFLICTSGKCELDVAGLTFPIGKSLYSTNTCPAIHTNVQQSNLIAVVAKGNGIYVFLNKVPVIQVTDNSSSGGLIGVTLNASTAEGEVAFNNMKVWTL